MRDLLIAFQKKKARKNGNIESSFFVDIIALKTKHLFFVFHRVVKWQKMSSSVVKTHEIRTLCFKGRQSLGILLSRGKLSVVQQECRICQTCIRCSKSAKSSPLMLLMLQSHLLRRVPWEHKGLSLHQKPSLDLYLSIFSIFFGSLVKWKPIILLACLLAFFLKSAGVKKFVWLSQLSITFLAKSLQQ